MLYLGFDASTQSISAVVVDGDDRSVVFRESFGFDETLPEYGTHHGVLHSPDPALVHAPPLMWREAVLRALQRVSTQIDAGRLRAVSGAAQQHGSVYCGDTPQELTRNTSPVWLDSSTVRECREIENALGGPAALASLTGSRAFPRFTGPQIRRFAKDDPAAYARTSRVHLVSSYLASVLIGVHAPVDHADASGMNLMDLRDCAWSPEAMAATAPGLSSKLPPLVPSSSVVGTLSAEWRPAFQLPAVRVVAWSGDNPCSLIGTGLIREGQLGISLGTSDTIYGPMAQPRVSADGTGHVFASPTGDYMGITVFRNGSLARERVRDAFGLTWAGFSDALRATDPGNGGAIMLPWFEPEITPSISRRLVVRVGLEGAPAARYVRALVEGQILSIARHSRWMGVSPREIYATGGGAVNREILQVVADAFDAPVYPSAAPDAAALGAALRALQADTAAAWLDVIEGFVSPPGDLVVKPQPRNVTTYESLQQRYIQLERDALAR